jgi:polyhydroxybutyrate depolymerase
LKSQIGHPQGACGAAGVRPGYVATQSFTVLGKKRTYGLTVPDGYDSKRVYPLVFVLHGDGGNGAGIRNTFRLEAESKSGAIFVYPDGTDQTWHLDEAGALKQDIAFVDGVVADLSSRLCVDKTRVSAVGFSRGAYFANMLACLSKSKLRSVVAHSGGGPYGVDGVGTQWDANGEVVCPAAPVAAMQIIGTADDLFGDAKKARDYWRRKNDCKATSSAFAPSPCVTFDGCSTGRAEVYCEIPNMGHAYWSAGATRATWAFISTK